MPRRESTQKPDSAAHSVYPAGSRADAASGRNEFHEGYALDVIDALNTLTTGVAIVSPDLRILSLNESLGEAFGVQAREFSGRMLWELLPGRESAPEAEMILDTARDGSPRCCCSLIGPLALEIRAERLDSGFVVVEVADSTVQARLERRFDHLLESITDGFCVLDGRWCIRYWNGAAERMTGLASRDVVGRHVNAAFGNMGGSALATLFLGALRQKTQSEIRSWAYEGDTSGRAAGIYDAYIYPVEGGGAVVIFREVSERVRQERELTERRLEAEALHALVRAIAAVNDSHQLKQLLATAAMERCNARGSAVIEAKGAEGVITAAAGDGMPAVGSRVTLAGSLTERVMREKSVIEVTDYSSEYHARNQQLSGESLGPVLATSLVAHDKSLGVLLVSRAPGAEPFSQRSSEQLGVMADHAALGLWKLRLVEQAHAANQAKNDFMATMSHELRTPLAALTGYGEILSEEVAGPLSEQQQDVVMRMQSVTNHLAGLIEEILTYSSLDADREGVELTDVVLSDVICDAIAVVEPMAKQKGIPLQYETGGDVRITTDPGKLRQILVHLTGNAVKFTQEGHVRLSVLRENGVVRLVVEDTGIGIAEESRARLFQPFSQLDAGLRRRHRGAGLGLFISRRLAELIGGSIEFRSKIGEGSTFTVTIPANGGGISQ